MLKHSKHAHGRTEIVVKAAPFSLCHEPIRSDSAASLGRTGSMHDLTARKSSAKLRNILAGWRNVVVKNPEIERLARARGAICLECPHRKRIVCGKCGCPLKAKLRAPEATCPDNRW